MIKGFVPRYPYKCNRKDDIFPIIDVERVFGMILKFPKFKNPLLHYHRFPALYGCGLLSLVCQKIMESQNTVNKKHILKVLHD
jgi:hypothetical protein